MDSVQVLNWIYDYKLVAANKRNAHLIYKLKIEGEDLSLASAEEKKSKLRAIENREKTKPEQVVSDYEKIIIDLYEIDVPFSLYDYYSSYLLARQIVTALLDLYEGVSKHKNEPGKIVSFNSLENLSPRESLFFLAVSGMNFLKCKGDFTGELFIDDAILNYPLLSIKLMRVNTLLHSVRSMDILGKTFVWEFVFFELLQENVGSDKKELHWNKMEKKGQEILSNVVNYVKSMPVKQSQLEEYMPTRRNAYVSCMMDYFYNFRIDFMTLIGCFIDKHEKLNSMVYLCPIWKKRFTELHKVHFIDEKQNLLFEFTRSTFGHYAEVYDESGRILNEYFEFNSTEIDDNHGLIRGYVTVCEDFNPIERDFVTTPTSIYWFSYSLDGESLVLYDDDDEILLDLKRADRAKSNHCLFAVQNKIGNNKEVYKNSLVDEWRYADISRSERYFNFTFVNSKNEQVMYRIETDSDPRLEYIKFNDIVYLYQSQQGEMYLTIEAVGFIPISFMERC